MSSSYRPDIDGLRGVAVLAVIGYHYFPSWVPGGFFGVDVFFVVSGFLITGILLDDDRDWRQRLSEFYARRIRRLFPALLLVVAATLLAAAILLFRFEFVRLVRHAVASLGFVQNILLIQEVGYFDGDARAKPFLHLWSLAVEEQFYLVWPLLMLLAGRSLRWLSAMMAMVTIVSLALAVGGSEPLAGFYSPLSRAWELGVGGLIALHRHRFELSQAVATSSGVAAIAALGATLLLDTTAFQHPGWITLLPVLATGTLIAAAPASRLVGNILSLRPAVAVGLISYPLYLWHWPPLAFAFFISGQAPSVPIRLTMILGAFLAATATYIWIERPIRSSWPPVRAAVTLAIAAIALAASAIVTADVWRDSTSGHAAQVRQQLAGPLWRFATNAVCEARFGRDYKLFCIQNRPGAPTILLFGNSFANHLYPGLIRHPATAGETILSYGTCEPSGYHRLENADCDALERIALGNSQLRLVVVANVWPRFDGEGRQLDNVSGRLLLGERAADAADYAAALTRRLRQLRAAGLEVVLIGTKAELGYDAARCFGRRLRPADRDCRVPFAEAERQIAHTRALLQRVADDVDGVVLVDPSRPFCTKLGCSFIDANGLPLLRDQGHLSELGSDRVADPVASAIRARLSAAR